MVLCIEIGVKEHSQWSYSRIFICKCSLHLLVVGVRLKQLGPVAVGGQLVGKESTKQLDHRAPHKVAAAELAEANGEEAGRQLVLVFSNG
jgi:hypothetical protein